MKAVNKIFYVITSLVKLALAWDYFATLTFFFCFDVRYFGKPRYNSVTVKVTKSAHYVMLRVHLGTDVVIAAGF